MRILYIANWYNSIYNNLFTEIRKCATYIKAIISKQYSPQPYHDKNIYIVRNCKDYTKLLNISSQEDFPTIIDFKELDEIIQQEKPDVIISNLFYQPSTWRACRLAKKNDIPLVLQTEIQRWPKGIMSLFSKVLFTFFFKRYWKYLSCVIAWTPTSQNFVKKHAQITNVFCSLPGIDTHHFKPMQKFDSKKLLKRKDSFPDLSLDSSSLNLLMVARYVPYKRHIDAIKAIDYLVNIKKEKNISLTFVGNAGGLQKSLQEEVAQRNLSAFIFFHKPISYQNIPKFMSCFDVLILPSYNEAIGMVVPEAMACGLPVIVSDSSGSQGYLKKGCGLLFKTYDHEDLAHKINIFKRKDILRAYSKRSVKHIQSFFSQEKVAQNYISLIKRSL